MVIEIDGLIHELEKIRENDEMRQKELEKLGLTVLRFTNEEIKNDIEHVLTKVREHLYTN